MTASILQWLQENELTDLHERERPYSAVCNLWKQAQEKEREAARLASQLDRDLPEGVDAVEAKDGAYNEMISTLVCTQWFGR